MNSNAQRARARARVAGLAADLQEQMAPRDLAGVLVGTAIDLLLATRTACVAAAWLRLVAAELEADAMERERADAKIEQRPAAPAQEERRT